jgi:hypothetical protein
MSERPSYKPTFLDRHGPDGALRIRAAGYGVMVFGTTVGAASFTGAPMMYTLVAAVTLSVAVYLGSMRIGTAAGDAMQYFTAGGSSTPYEEQFSQEQALVMQRDYAGALALYEGRIAASPGEQRVRVAAADLYVTHGDNPRRAAELYREVQRSPEVSTGHDVYVSNKLADLYLGPLDEPRRALVEFRRLIERYPGSTAAKHARLALANLKEDMIRDHTSS